jgi:hypothetical protein
MLIQMALVDTTRSTSGWDKERFMVTNKPVTLPKVSYMARPTVF